MNWDFVAVLKFSNSGTNRRLWDRSVRNMNHKEKRFNRMRPTQSRQMPSLTLSITVSPVVQEASTSQNLDVLYVAV